jgi:N-acetylmuramoyl-L-alanine amidase
VSYAEVSAAVVSLLVSQQHIPPVPVDQVNCLAEAIYYEAGGEDRRGQLLVADVVLNRVASPSFPSTVCTVIHQRGQFTFKRRPLAAKARTHFREIVELAARRYAERLPRLTTATFFYNARLVRPAWATRLRLVERHGPHVFMRAHI